MEGHTRKGACLFPERVQSLLLVTLWKHLIAILRQSLFFDATGKLRPELVITSIPTALSRFLDRAACAQPRGQPSVLAPPSPEEANHDSPGHQRHRAGVCRLNAVYPDVSTADRVCLSCINRAISDEIDLTIEQEQQDFANINAEAERRLSTQEAVTRNLNDEYDRTLPFGERMADRVASFGGSWRFIGLFVGVLVLWIVVNAVHLLARPFDPYPFILLNLVLSCVAAL